MIRNEQPWNKRVRIPDPQVRDAAEQFDDARILLQQRPPGSGVLLPLLNTAAVAIELYLKSLSSHLTYQPVQDGGGISIVYAVPPAKSHELVNLLEAIPQDIRDELESAFALSHLQQYGSDLRTLLASYEGLFAASRYPFEPVTDIGRYPLAPLMALSTFLRAFVAGLAPRDRIEWP
jgi:hypothetical protein